MHTRDDHVVIVYHPDNTMVVEHADGTRITTVMQAIGTAANTLASTWANTSDTLETGSFTWRPTVVWLGCRYQCK